MGDSETNCRTVIERVFLYIDGEIAGGECAEIDRHLELCARCLDHYGFERELKLMVKRRCSEGSVPADLAQMLRARIEQFLEGS